MAVSFLIFAWDFFWLHHCTITLLCHCGDGLV